MKILLVILMMGGGVFSLCGSIMDCDFFFNNYKAQFMIQLLGRTGARIFYAVLGAFIIFFSIMVLISVEL